MKATAPTVAAALCSTVLLTACGGGADPTDPSASSSAALSASASATTLVVQNSGKCIDVPDASTSDSLQLQQYSCNGTVAQSFAMTTNANGTVTFTNVHSGKCIDVRSDLTTNGNPVQQYACNGGEAQTFTLVPASSGASDVYSVKTSHGLCLDVAGPSTANGAKLQEWGCYGSTNQSFQISGAPTTSTPPAPAPTGNVKYLSQLGARCNGSDDSAAVSAAVTGARNNAYTLMVDCAATLDIGLNVDRSIFIDNGTTVQFTSAGKFLINNLFEPAFVLANTSNVKLVDWNVEWNNAMPVSMDTGTYSLGGKAYAVTGNGSGVFNDKILSDWLTANRGITFVDGPTHGIWANWQGSVNTSAIFYIIGSTTDVTVTGLNLSSANTSEPFAYIPFGVLFGRSYKSNMSVSTSTGSDAAATASQYFDVPRRITFDDVTLDGILMGFQGNTIDSTFSNLKVEHVSDMQDAQGNNVGGVGQNFPPPHLFYLNYEFDGDPALANSGIAIKNVDEVGPRTGNVRPGGGGYADSLKLGCNACTVDGYTTNRKDGFMDVLDSNGLTVSNVVATYDSSFVDEYAAWPGWRWPGGGTPAIFKNITFSNVTLTDLAAETVDAPLSNNTATGNSNIVFDDVNIIMQSWTKGRVYPTWTGIAAGSFITFHLKAQGTTQTLEP